MARKKIALSFKENYGVPKNLQSQPPGDIKKSPPYSERGLLFASEN